MTETRGETIEDEGPRDEVDPDLVDAVRDWIAGFRERTQQEPTLSQIQQGVGRRRDAVARAKRRLDAEASEQEAVLAHLPAMPPRLEALAQDYVRRMWIASHEANADALAALHVRADARIAGAEQRADEAAQLLSSAEDEIADLERRLALSDAAAAEATQKAADLEAAAVVLHAQLDEQGKLMAMLVANVPQQAAPPTAQTPPTPRDHGPETPNLPGIL